MPAPPRPPTRPNSYQQFQNSIVRRPAPQAPVRSNPGSLNGIPNIPSVQAEAQGHMDAIAAANRMGLVYQPQNPVGAPAPSGGRNVVGASSGGSRGGGGGGGGGSNTAAMQAAYQAAMEWMKSQNGDFLRDPALLDAIGSTAGLDARLGRYEQSARDANQQAMTGINDAAARGNARLDEVVAMLGQRLGQARGDVQGVFRGNAADLNSVAAQAQGRSGAVADEVGVAAQGFGFQPAQDVQGLGDLAQAILAAQGAKASAYDAAYADRQNVYGGLQADVSRGIVDRQGALAGQATQALQSLLSDAAVRRTEGYGAIEQAKLAEMSRQSQAAAQFNQQNMQSIYQMMIDAAQQGVKL